MGRGAVKGTGPESAARLQIPKIDGAHNDTPRLDHDRCRTGDLCDRLARNQCRSVSSIVPT
jgi:hypothetical protein